MLVDLLQNYIGPLGCLHLYIRSQNSDFEMLIWNTLYIVDSHGYSARARWTSLRDAIGLNLVH